MRAFPTRDGPRTPPATHRLRRYAQRHWASPPSPGTPGAAGLPNPAFFNFNDWTHDEPTCDGRTAPECARWRQTRKTDRLGGQDGRVNGGRRCSLVRRQHRRIRPPVRTAGGRRHVQEAQPRTAPEQLPRLQQPERRGARRRPHVHLLAEQGRRRPDQQLGGTGRDACTARNRPARRHPGAVSRLHAGAHDVRGAVLDGAAGARRSRTSASSSPTARTSPST